MHFTVQIFFLPWHFFSMIVSFCCRVTKYVIYIHPMYPFTSIQRAICKNWQYFNRGFVSLDGKWSNAWRFKNIHQEIRKLLWVNGCCDKFMFIIYEDMTVDSVYQLLGICFHPCFTVYNFNTTFSPSKCKKQCKTDAQPSKRQGLTTLNNMT